MIKLDFMRIIEPIIVNYIVVSISLCIALSNSKVCCTKKSLYVAAICKNGEWQYLGSHPAQRWVAPWFSGGSSLGQGLKTGDLDHLLMLLLVTQVSFVYSCYEFYRSDLLSLASDGLSVEGRYLK